MLFKRINPASHRQDRLDNDLFAGIIKEFGFPCIHTSSRNLYLSQGARSAWYCSLL
jgi:hypothetical protein